jgi:hypothetical protein
MLLFDTGRYLVQNAQAVECDTKCDKIGLIKFGNSTHGVPEYGAEEGVWVYEI